MPEIWVLTGVELGKTSLAGLGAPVTDAGVQLDAAGTRAETLESDLRSAGNGLRAVADALDGQP